MGSKHSKQCMPHILVNIKYQVHGHSLSVMVPQGFTLSDILDDFMKLFAHQIPQDSKPSDFKFQLVQGQNLVDQTNDYTLKNNDLLVARFSRTMGRREPGPIIPHPIEPDTPYYMWSMCSQANDALMKLDSGIIKCDGKSSDPPNVIQFTTNDVSSLKGRRFVFTLPSGNPNKVYAIKGQGEDKPVIAQELDKSAIKQSIGDEYKFECLQFFCYMQYRCEKVEDRIDLYMSALQDGRVQLQKAGKQGYPRPSTLFIATNMI